MTYGKLSDCHKCCSLKKHGMARATKVRRGSTRDDRGDPTHGDEGGSVDACYAGELMEDSGDAQC